jgi:hypothetical protein
MTTPPRTLAAAIGTVLLATAGTGYVAYATTQLATTSAAPTEQPEDPLTTAATDCKTTSHADLAADGSSITYDGVTTDAGLKNVACVMTALHAPDSVIAKIDRTRALDGVVEDSWSTYKASWTYHPDRGLDLIIEHR